MLKLQVHKSMYYFSEEINEYAFHAESEKGLIHWLNTF